MKVGNDVNRDKQETPFIFFTVREAAQGKKKKKQVVGEGSIITEDNIRIEVF